MVEIDTVKIAHLEAIMAAGRRIHEAIDTIDVIVSARLGVHRNDLRCLHLLESGPTTPGHVAAHTGLTSGSVTALLDRLESAGFVERCRSTEDRRSVAVAIPAARLIELRTIYEEIGSAVRDHFDPLDTAALAQTSVALGRFADALAGFATHNGLPACPTGTPHCP